MKSMSADWNCQVAGLNDWRENDCTLDKIFHSHSHSHYTTYHIENRDEHS